MSKKIFSILSIVLSIICLCLGLAAFLVASIDTIKISSDSLLISGGFTKEQVANMNLVALDDEEKGSDEAWDALKDDDTFTVDLFNEVSLSLSDNKEDAKTYKKVKKDSVSDIIDAAAAVAKRTTCYILAFAGIAVGIVALVLLKFTTGAEKHRAASLSNLAKVGMLVQIIVIAMYFVAYIQTKLGL